MAITRRTLIFAAAALASSLSAFATTIREATANIVHLYHQAKESVFGYITAAFKAVAAQTAAIVAIATPLVQAKAYVTRLAKRERPELTGSWRMCPST